MSTATLASLQVTSDSEWVDLVDVPGASLEVRSLDFPAYVMARSVLLQKFSRKYGRKPIPIEILTPALGKLYAEHILLNWKGFDVPFSKEESMARLTDWSWRKFFAQVEWAAGTLSDINAEFTEETIKN